MYFEEPDVRRLFTAIVEGFDDVILMFDAIPPWFARRTLKGYHRTRHYTAPPMPWGVTRGAIEKLLRGWSSRVVDVTTWNYGTVGNRRGDPNWLLRLFAAAPVLRDIPPSIARVRAHSAYGSE
jgi:hypothetical protein